jgi:hypothetical protein
MSDDLSLFTIYDHPTDVPEPFGFVVREWHIRKEGAVPDPEARFAMTLEEARTLIPPGLYRLERNPEDDPKIVETWL